MNKYILSINCGSSSLKFNLFSVLEHNKLVPYIHGIVEEIGNSERSLLKYTIDGSKNEIKIPIASHQEALILLFSEFQKLDIRMDSICGVGHRVVHGGDKYTHSVLIDDKVIGTINDLIPIAPLHNAPNLKGIEEAIKLLPGIPQVAVFDTAFHGEMPSYAYRYAIPNEWYQKYGVRRYGFHGISHLYVARRAAKFLGIPYEQFHGITVHLGNGCSITKIRNGKSVDTSMGFTPLEGLVMGTRSGDIDPALISYVANSLIEEKCLSEGDAYRSVMQALNKQSGLKALTGTSIMQDIRQKAVEGDLNAEIALSIYAYRIAKYIGSYWATLPDTHAIVFTAGVGENEGYIRAKIIKILENLSFSLNEENNGLRQQEIVIATSNINKEHPLSVLVIPTDEEIVIGYDTLFIGYLKQDIPSTYPFED